MAKMIERVAAAIHELRCPPDHSSVRMNPTDEGLAKVAIAALEPGDRFNGMVVLAESETMDRETKGE